MSDWEEESELTDISDEEVPLSTQKGKKKAKFTNDDDDSSAYRIRGALKVPRVANYTTQSLHGM